MAQESKYYLYMFIVEGSRWIPSHVGIRGNEVVDASAKAALGRSEVNFKVVLGVKALVAVAEKVMLEKWQSRWNTNVKGRFFYAIKPTM